MAELVANCPRCGAKSITFDLTAANLIRTEYGWQGCYETFCCCRHCGKSTIFILSDQDRRAAELTKRGLAELSGVVNPLCEVESFVNIKDLASQVPPDHVPEEIAGIFNEGAACLAFGCHNAAGTMFRLCIDLVTQQFLPAENPDGLTRKIRRTLGLRLSWLFDNHLLPEALRELSDCVREDGNDGAHVGNLTAAEAGDIQEFTVILLTRIYTEPARIAIAEERRKTRRQAEPE